MWRHLITASVLCAGVAHAEARPTFLVTEIVVDEGIEGIDKDAARDVLANRFGRLRDKIEVRSLAEMKTTLDKSALAQMTGSDRPDEALANINSYLDVDRLVFGRITKVGGVTEVQVRIFNAREGTTEIGLARRMKPDAPPQLVLTLLDSLADGLLAYVLDTYTDAAPSEQYNKLADKKLTRPAKDEPGDATDEAPVKRAGTLAVVGGALAGAGVGVLGAGSLALGLGGLEEGEQTTAYALLGGGAGAALVGGALIAVDAFVLE